MAMPAPAPAERPPPPLPLEESEEVEAASMPVGDDCESSAVADADDGLSRPLPVFEAAVPLVDAPAEPDPVAAAASDRACVVASPYSDPTPPVLSTLNSGPTT
jgi:hypothetical protein